MELLIPPLKLLFILSPRLFLNNNNNNFFMSINFIFSTKSTELCIFLRLTSACFRNYWNRIEQFRLKKIQPFHQILRRRSHRFLWKTIILSISKYLSTFKFIIAHIFRVINFIWWSSIRFLSEIRTQSSLMKYIQLFVSIWDTMDLW